MQAAGHLRGLCFGGALSRFEARHRGSRVSVLDLLGIGSYAFARALRFARNANSKQ